MKNETQQCRRNHLEVQIARCEANARTREEWVFNGYATCRDVASEIRFWRDQARGCRFLLMFS
jgi:hypothetical protein